MSRSATKKHRVAARPARAAAAVAVLAMLPLPLPAAPAPTPFIQAAVPPAAGREIVATWYVDAQGKVSDIRLVPPPPNRDTNDAIRTFIHETRFRPRTRDGKPTSAVLTHTFLLTDIPHPSIPGDRDAPAPLGGFADLVLPGPLPASDKGKTYTATWTVSEEGSASDISVSPESSPALQEAIISSIKRLRFLPATHRGKAVKARMSHFYRIG